MSCSGREHSLLYPPGSHEHGSISQHRRCVSGTIVRRTLQGRNRTHPIHVQLSTYGRCGLASHDRHTNSGRFRAVFRCQDPFDEFACPRNQGPILDRILDQGDDHAMAKVTGKFQITLPKALVERCGIRVGDELELRAIGHSIHIDCRGPKAESQRSRDKLAHFDQATRRQQIRARSHPLPQTRSRGWTREELYVRGRAR